MASPRGGLCLTEKTDLAFRPFGLDLFDKLVKACKAGVAELPLHHSEKMLHPAANHSYAGAKYYI